MRQLLVPFPQALIRCPLHKVILILCHILNGFPQVPQHDFFKNNATDRVRRTYSTIHLTIMTLLAPTDSSGRTMENDALCKKVIVVKEKHNPRVDTFISTMKNILVAQLESWINQFTNNQEIY